MRALVLGWVVWISLFTAYALHRKSEVRHEFFVTEHGLYHECHASRHTANTDSEQFGDRLRADAGFAPPSMSQAGAPAAALSPESTFRAAEPAAPPDFFVLRI